MKKASNGNNILYVIPYFVPAWSYGGTVKVSYDFAKELIRLGYKVTVVTTDALDDKLRNKVLKENIDGINIIRFKNVSNYLAKHHNLYTPIGFKKWLKNNINSYDVVHVHEIFTYQSIITTKRCSQINKPYVVQPHGSLYRFATESRLNHLKHFVIKRFKSLLLNGNKIIVLSEEEKMSILDIFPQIKTKIKIIPNGINLSEFKDIKKVNLHEIYKIPQKNKVIVFIGRIKYVKGIDISLNALSKLKNDIKFTFLIIGPDEGEKRNLEVLSEKLGLKNNVIFTGLLSGVRKLETLKSADISLLNSRSEGLPTTLLESAALGVPIVCSKESNLPEVDKFNAGYIVHNVEETAQKIRLILEDDILQKKLSQNTLNLADNFNLTKCSQLLDELYRSVI